MCRARAVTSRAMEPYGIEGYSRPSWMRLAACVRPEPAELLMRALCNQRACACIVRVPKILVRWRHVALRAIPSPYECV